MTWLEFIELGAQEARQLSGDPNLKLLINNNEIDLSKLKFELVKDNSKNYDDYNLVISN